MESLEGVVALSNLKCLKKFSFQSFALHNLYIILFVTGGITRIPAGMTDSNTRQHRNTTSVWCGRGSRGQRQRRTGEDKDKGHGRGNYQQYSPKKLSVFIN